MADLDVDAGTGIDRTLIEELGTWPLPADGGHLAHWCTGHPQEALWALP